jgi:hypothetical protein
MAHKIVSPEHGVSPVQVWARLTAEHRSQVIRLMAQLAFKLVLTQSDSPFKEVQHGPEQPQNSG